MRTANKLKLIGVTLLVLPLLYCTKSGSDNQDSSKLETITQEQKIILSRLDTIEGNQKTLLKNSENLAKSIKNVETAIKSIKTDKKDIANNQNKGDKVYNIPVGNSFVLGPKDAKVTVIEWMDFQ